MLTVQRRKVLEFTRNFPGVISPSIIVQQQSLDLAVATEASDSAHVALEQIERVRDSGVAYAVRPHAFSASQLT